MAALSLALLAVALARAEPAVTCVERKGAAYKEPQTLAALRRCHQERMAAARTSAKTEPSAATLDRWDDLQRAEVADYLSRNPDRATMAEEKWRPEPLEKGERSASADKTAPYPEEEAIDRAARKDEAAKEDKGGFEKRMWDMSEGGKKGITPEMAKEMIRYIRGQQDQPVSADTLDLLEAVSKDGPNLTDSTVEKLRGAARKAKGSGMSLGIDPEMEKELLRDPEPRRAPSL